VKDIFQIFLVTFFVVLFVLTSQVTADAGLEKNTLVIARVSSNPEKHHKELALIVNYVVDHLKDSGITKGSVLIAKDLQELIKWLNEGKVDWVTDTPYPALILSEETGAEIILRRWKKGVPGYYSVFFVRKDSGINTLADLKGKTIAFEDTGSTSAFSLPLSVLKSKGLEMEELSSPREKATDNRVGYVFAGEELNIITWVFKGLADAGVFSNMNWEDPACTPEIFKKELKIIDKSILFPRCVELLRGELDPEIKNRIKEVLLKADQDPMAEEALKAYDKTKKFDEFKGDIKDELLEAQKLLKFVREELK